MYLGCNSNACQMYDSLIEGNYIHHTDSGVSQGDGIEIKEGSYNNTVRDNVIHDTNYPCIITYATVGNGGPNVIERNVLWGCGDHGIQAAADAIIRNNIILSAVGDGIRNQAHQSGQPSNLVISHNTILAPNGNALRVNDMNGSVVIANNALYAQVGNAIQIGGPDVSALTVAGNVGVGGTQGFSGGFAGGSLMSDFIAANYSGAVPNDVFPATGSALIDAGDVAHVASDDFNGTPRAGVADAGAYAYDSNGNPGWPLAPGPKDIAPMGGVGGGVGGGGAPGSGGASNAGGAASGGDTAAGGGANGASGVDGGCDCRAAPGGGSAGFWLFLLSAFALRTPRRASMPPRRLASTAASARLIEIRLGDQGGKHQPRVCEARRRLDGFAPELDAATVAAHEVRLHREALAILVFGAPHQRAVGREACGAVGAGDEQLCARGDARRGNERQRHLTEPRARRGVDAQHTVFGENEQSGPNREHPHHATRVEAPAQRPGRRFDCKQRALRSPQQRFGHACFYHVEAEVGADDDLPDWAG
jgi:hypothetical protein